jgi:hypothetical protein
MASSSYDHSVALQKFIPFVDFFRYKIVQILIVTFECLYFPDGSRRTRGLAVIQVLAEYGRYLYSRAKVVDLLNAFLVTFAPILHEIWTIYSFARDVLSITRLEDINFFVQQMDIHGLLKSI